ncbi:MAG: hypothetical protein CSA75_03690 [Sorangium cellulosum]|nr:MAG: hypothetical protein CSA75_03690 [Sorangium cellulosum]
MTVHDLGRRSELDDIAKCCVAEHQAAPCAAVASAFRTAKGWSVGVGAYGRLSPNGQEATPQTIFDLASLTKPFAALVLARLVRGKLVDWQMPLGVPLRDVHGTPSAEVPLALFAAHRAGLDGHRPLYAPLESGRSMDRFIAFREAANARRSECQGPAPEDGFQAYYSDLGYLLLGEAMARASGTRTDDLIWAHVCEPLGLGVRSVRQHKRLDSEFMSAVAPTEYISWRGLVRGHVHDENAWALGGEGCCGHAGLFGTARDVAVLGASILDAHAGRLSGWLLPEQIDPLLRIRKGSTWRAGFDGKSEQGSSAGDRCSIDTFGHLGFTGTSIWIDPVHEVVVSLLTNRVHPRRDHLAIKKSRPVVHNALFQWGIEQR